MIVTFIVEGEPQGKARHRTTKTGHVNTPKKTVAYGNKVKMCMSQEQVIKYYKVL